MLSETRKSAKRIASLLVQYIKDAISLDEKDELMRWRDASSSNQKLFDECTAPNFFEEALLESEAEPEYREMIWENVRQKTVVRSKKRRLYISLSAAASIALIVGTTATLLLQTQKRLWQQNQVVDMAPGKPRAILKLGDGKRIYIETDSTFTHQSTTGAQITNTGNSLSYQAAEVKETLYDTLEIPRGAEYKIVLSDGTAVYLNSESKLYYPEVFKGNQRKVKLAGEAFFEVAKNKTLPFIVEVDGKEIQVLGTSFNVRNYPEDKGMATTLVEGKVKVQSQAGAIFLSPGQQAVFNPSTESMEVREVDTKYYTAWHDGRLIYDNEPLENIFIDLSRWYDFDISYLNPDAKQIRFSCNLERYENLNAFVTLLEKTNKVKVNLAMKSLTIETP
ncbi:MAG: DUF4974 domain-containing protein [Bacteroidales bacterium]|nr:MAG: DUF4974 domain-containing protein [Bacteroidales bacterium]